MFKFLFGIENNKNVIRRLNSQKIIMKKQVDSIKYSYAKSDLFKDLQEKVQSRLLFWYDFSCIIATYSMMIHPAAKT